MADEKDPFPLVISLCDGDVESLLYSLDTTAASSTDQPSVDVTKSQLQNVDAGNILPMAKLATCLECHEQVPEEGVNQHLYCKHMDARLIRCSRCPYSLKYNLTAMTIHCKDEHSDLASLREAVPVDQRDEHLATAEQLRKKCFPDLAPLQPCNSEAESASVARKLSEWEQNAPARHLAKARQEKLFPPVVKKRKISEPLEALGGGKRRWSPSLLNDNQSPSASGGGKSSADTVEEEEEEAAVPHRQTVNRQLCAICKMNVRTDNFSMHIWNHHMAAARFACQHCQWTTKNNKTAMNEHLRQVHPQEVPAFVDRKDELQTVYYEAFSRCFGPGNCMRLRFSRLDASALPSAAASDHQLEANTTETVATEIAETAEPEQNSENGGLDFTIDSSLLNVHQTEATIEASTVKKPIVELSSVDCSDHQHLPSLDIDAVIDEAGEDKEDDENASANEGNSHHRRRPPLPLPPPLEEQARIERDTEETLNTTASALLTQEERLAKCFDGEWDYCLLEGSPGEDQLVNRIHIGESLLCARSPTLAAMLKGELGEHPVIAIDGFSYKDVRAMARFCQMLVLEAGDDRCTLLRMAIKYEIGDLKRACTEYLLMGMSPVNAVQMLLLAEEVNDEALLAAAIAVIVANFAETKKTADYQLLKDKPQLLFQLLEQLSEKK